MKLGFMKTVLKIWEVRNQVLSVCLSLLPPTHHVQVSLATGSLHNFISAY